MWLWMWNHRGWIKITLVSEDQNACNKQSRRRNLGSIQLTLKLRSSHCKIDSSLSPNYDKGLQLNRKGNTLQACLPGLRFDGTTESGLESYWEWSCSKHRRSTIVREMHWTLKEKKRLPKWKWWWLEQRFWRRTRWKQIKDSTLE